MKKKRRTLKNRGYAETTRRKKEDEIKKLEAELKHLEVCLFIIHTIHKSFKWKKYGILKCKKYIDMKKHQSVFLKNKPKISLKKLKKSKKLSNAFDEVKQFFVREASEAKEYYSSS